MVKLMDSNFNGKPSAQLLAQTWVTGIATDVAMTRKWHRRKRGARPQLASAFAHPLDIPNVISQAAQVLRTHSVFGVSGIEEGCCVWYVLR